MKAHFSDFEFNNEPMKLEITKLSLDTRSKQFKTKAELAKHLSSPVVRELVKQARTSHCPHSMSFDNDFNSPNHAKCSATDLANQLRPFAVVIIPFCSLSINQYLTIRVIKIRFCAHIDGRYFFSFAFQPRHSSW